METTQTTAAQQTNWGSIAQSAAGTFQAALNLFPKVRDNQLAIAQANASAAASQAQAAEASKPKDNTVTYVIAGILLVLVILLLMRKK